MLLPTLLSTSALALTATAFLVPPHVSSDEPAIHDIIPSVFSPSSQSVNLDCSTCPFALNSKRKGSHEWTNDVKSELPMKITAEGDRLLLNEVPFFPLSTPSKLPPPLFVKQLKRKGEDAGKFEGFDGNLRLSYSLEVEATKKVKDDTVVEIVLTVMGLDGQMVRIENLEIKAIRGADGKLTLISVFAVPPSSADAKCTSILCRVLTKLLTKIHAAKTHAKTAAHKVKCFCVKSFGTLRGRPHFHTHYHGKKPSGTSRVTGGRLPTHHHSRPGSFKAQMAHRHRAGWMHEMLRAAKNIVKFVVLPIAVGITFGIAVSAVGMLVGQLVVLAWLKLRRGGRETVKYQVLEVEEKEGLPKYEDLEADEVVVAENEKK